MTKHLSRGEFALPYIVAHAAHLGLRTEIELLVPAKAEHKPAVRRFLQGRYFEAFSHLAFTRIMAHKGGCNAVHAGAFFGDMLHTLSRCCGRVYAFEPVLDNYVFAKRNADRLGLDNVMLFNAGLSDVSGVLPIRVSEADGRDAGGGSSFLDGRKAAGFRSENATVLRLDNLPIEDLGLLQLDVEGHELRALRGAEALIRRTRPVVLVEDLRGDCEGFLAGLGYAFCFARTGLKYWALPEDLAFVRSLEPQP
jgi:FkbM family methyltransferase